MGARIYLSYLFICLAVITLIAKEPEYYVSTERLNVTYVNPKYGYLNATAARPGRWDYKYYVNSYILLLVTLDNNVRVDAWFYEFRSNEYRRGFVEMHFGLCDLIQKDFFFGPALRANHLECPVKPGEYHLSNMSIPDLPLLGTFPFRKGRIYGVFEEAGERILEGYIDMEIKIKPRVRSKANTVNASRKLL